MVNPCPQELLYSIIYLFSVVPSFVIFIFFIEIVFYAFFTFFSVGPLARSCCSNTWCSCLGHSLCVPRTSPEVCARALVLSSYTPQCYLTMTSEPVPSHFYIRVFVHRYSQLSAIYTYLYLYSVV